MTQLTSRPTALVVETNYLVASVFEAPLVAAGYRVMIATNPEEAFELLDREDIRLALIDFRLQHGEPNGLVARLLRSGVPFIFCTAASADEVLEHFPDARVMAKPFSDEALLQAVTELVQTAGISANKPS
jgi:CheY-like chemotaxis protein